MELYNKLIRNLCARLPEKRIEAPRSDILRDYYNNKYPTKPIYYAGRYLYGAQNRIRCDVRDFFTLNDESLHNIIKSLKMANMTDNQKALACLKWIITNFPYKSDNANYNKSEFWCMPFESLSKQSGDCEDGAILLANLLIIAGVPNWKIRVNCGYVFEPISKKQVGHAYLTFFDEDNEKWVIVDWCYYPNLKKINSREEYKKETMYQDIWFSFNNENSWAILDADVRNMEGFE